MQTDLQLHKLREIHDRLPIDLQETLARVLNVLKDKMSAAVRDLSKLQQPVSNGSARPLKFAFTKNSIDRKISELVDWQKTFDITWLLILRIQDSFVDRSISGTNVRDSSTMRTAASIRDALKMQPSYHRHITLPPDTLNQASTVEPIRWSDVVTYQKSGKFHLIDRLIIEPDSSRTVSEKDVRTIVSRLNCLDNQATLHLGLLHCRGAIWETEQQQLKSIALVFKPPPGFTNQLRTLREVLLNPPAHSLTQRFRLAQNLARAVCSVHNLDLVHKNVRPETILECRDAEDAIGPVYLFGLQNFRHVDAATLRRGDEDWWKNVYRHPSRQGLHPERTYSMHHDIYSLGVCLLEIGLWEPLVVYDYDDSGEEGPRAGSLLRRCGEWSEECGTRGVVLLKDDFVQLAMEELSGAVGDRYRDVVVNCLTCLDDENADFVDLIGPSSDGISIATRYIDMVRALFPSDLVDRLLTCIQGSFSVGRHPCLVWISSAFSEGTLFFCVPLARGP
jgi:hypothetical protein